MWTTLHSWGTIPAKLGRTRRNQRKRGHRNYLARRVRFEWLEDRKLLATVNTAIDANIDNDGLTTLREAIRDTLDGGMVNFASSLSGATIAINPDLGEIAFSKSLTIDASMLTNGITIDASMADSTPDDDDGFGIRIFDITDSTFGSNPPEVTLKNLTLTGGDVFGHGGAIRSNASLALDHCTITGNSAIGEGGGIYASVPNGFVTIQSSRISGNHATSFGGGLSFDGIALNLQQQTEIRDNSAVGAGGGLYAAVSVPYASITIDETTIDNNTCTGSNSKGGGAYVVANSNSATVTITGTVVSNNKSLGTEANVAGLSILAQASDVVIDRSIITGNHADDDVGGLYVDNLGSDVTITNSTISGNTASFINGNSANYAAGAWLRTQFGGQTTVKYSTISGNEVIAGANGDPNAPGAGLYLQSYSGITTLLNTTISGNRAEGSGGGIIVNNNAEIRILHCTITNNRADSDGDGSGQGGGIFIGNSALSVTIEHTIIAGNFRGTGSTRDDIHGSLTANWSLIGDNTGATINGANNRVGTGTSPIDPYLLPLALNGGPTMTHALQAISPARNMGDPSAVPGENNVPQFDQRGAGFARKVGSRIDIGAFEADVACIYVSTTIDEIDQDLSYGDLSLREAVNYANGAGEPVRICLPTGEYGLTVPGTGGVSQGDLDVTGNVTIVGDGPGLSIIDGSSSSSGRMLDVATTGVLNLSGVTLATGHGTSNSDQRNGGAVRVNNGGQLHMDRCAVVGNETGGWGLGGGIYFAPTASGSIESSVITVNYGDQQTGGLYIGGGTVTIKNTIVANNTDNEGTESPNIFVASGSTLTSLGFNRFTPGFSGFTPNTALGDYVGTVDYVVTSIADTYDGSSDPVNMSLRDAIDLANTTAGTQTIWLPAWDFVLTRQRDFQTQLTDIDVTFGDLDITDSLVLRGIGGANGPATSVAWAPGAVADKVFELVGDYNGDGVVSPAADYVQWRDAQGHTGSNLPEDGNDDGVVDELDESYYHVYEGNTLQLFDIAS